MKTMSSQIDRKAIIFAMVSSVLLCSMCSQPSFATDFTPPDNRDTWFIAFVATVYSVSEIREQPPQPVKWDVLTAIFEPEKLNIFWRRRKLLSPQKGADVLYLRAG